MGVAKRPEYEKLGLVIREAREELGLTQRGLARQVHRTETSIHKIEAGAQRVDLVELYDIAKALRVDLAELSRRFERSIDEQG